MEDEFLSHLRRDAADRRSSTYRLGDEMAQSSRFTQKNDSNWTSPAHQSREIDAYEPWGPSDWPKITGFAPSARQRLHCQSICSSERARCDASVDDAQYRGIMAAEIPGVDLYNGWKSGRLERRKNPDCQFAASYNRCLSEKTYSGPAYLSSSVFGQNLNQNYDPSKMSSKLEERPLFTHTPTYGNCRSDERERRKHRCEQAVQEAQYRGVMGPGAPGFDLYNGWKAGRLERRLNDDCRDNSYSKDCWSKSP